MWFEKLLGFKEENPEQVRQNLILDGNDIISKVTQKRYTCGTLEIATLKELKASSPVIADFDGEISISELVGNVQELHMDTENKDAVFQSASQFNLLEMIGPNVSPLAGIDIYEHDYTQGPACAIACGAGTVYRNYLVPVNNQIGQTAHKQIDCLDEIGKALENHNSSKWAMRNGYALANVEGLKAISKQLESLSPTDYEFLKEKLKIGIQWNTEVTISSNKQLVSQVYCSALPVRYSQIESQYWEDFAKLILEATYEATFYVALKNYQETGINKLFLTLVGGGAFGNEPSWIFNAIGKSIKKFINTPLDVMIVSYGNSNPEVQAFILKMNKNLIK